MSIHDEKLSKLLKSWHNVEPSSAFESNVWRRIHQLPAEQPDTYSFTHFLLEWINMRPAYVTAAAAFAGVVLGVTGALTAPTPSNDLHNNLFRPLPEQSLSASYVHLIEGEQQ